MSLLNKIQRYPRKTLEQSLKEVMQSRNKMISGKFSPIVFNMKYKEINFKTIDGINLYGWLIKTEGATKTLVFLHGRFNNRIFCLKFLQLFLDMNLKDKYNIFIPDLRNSGKSDEAKTAFGYYFAKDVISSLKHLKDKYNFNNFVLFGFSQGGMAAAITPYIYEKELEENNIVIEKMILDSPVSNIKKIIQLNAYIYNIKIPYLIVIWILSKLNKDIDNRLNELCLSTLLGKVPTLILQSEKDEVTPFDMIKEEYDILKIREEENNLKKTYFKSFRKGQHVRIYLEFKQEYTQTINNFLESEII